MVIISIPVQSLADYLLVNITELKDRLTHSSAVEIFRRVANNPVDKYLEVGISSSIRVLPFTS